jgi:hypothetical protein
MIPFYTSETGSKDVNFSDSPRDLILIEETLNMSSSLIAQKVSVIEVLGSSFCDI